MAIIIPAPVSLDPFRLSDGTDRPHVLDAINRFDGSRWANPLNAFHFASPLNERDDRMSPRSDSHLLRFGRCVSAEAAAVLAAFEEEGLRRTFAAADAAFALVTSRFALLGIELTSFPYIREIRPPWTPSHRRSVRPWHSS
jgi:hypothetical protein